MVTMKSAGKLYLACQAENRVVVVDTENDTVSGSIEIQGAPANLLLSPDERHLCVACLSSGEVVLVDTASDQIASRIGIGDSAMGLCFSGDGKLLLATDYCGKKLSAIDFPNREVLKPSLPTRDADGNPFGIAAVDDGRTTKVFVTKESWPPRISCPNPIKNTSDNIAVFLIQKPAEPLSE
jgi:DNA-binding beta-propeller fold protein YncE